MARPPESAGCFRQGRGFRAPQLQCGPGPERYGSDAHLRDLSRATGVPLEHGDDRSGVDALADHGSGVRVVVCGAVRGHRDRGRDGRREPMGVEAAQPPRPDSRERLRCRDGKNSSVSADQHAARCRQSRPTTPGDTVRQRSGTFGEDECGVFVLQDADSSSWRETWPVRTGDPAYAVTESSSVK